MELKELIASIDIVEYISQFVDLEQKGSEWWGFSCFKEERTPSFSVRRDPPFFYDYSSGKSGNLFHFVKYYNHCSSKEAVEIIKKYAGYNGEIDAQRGKMAATLVCERYKPPNLSNKLSHMEPNGQICPVKNKKTVILPQDYMLRYEKREDKLAVWEAEGISKASLDKFQVYYDGFSDRLVYPIRDMEGNIVNIGGRALDSEWKEKKMRKYTYFFSWNGGMKVIYGLYENLEAIKQAGEVIIFEGCKSVLIANSWGIENTACLLTSHLNPSQMKILAKLGCRVVFALDKDVNVRDDRNIKKLKRYVNCDYLWDKNDLLLAKDSPVDEGKDIFNRLYSQRIRYR